MNETSYAARAHSFLSFSVLKWTAARDKAHTKKSVWTLTCHNVDDIWSGYQLAHTRRFSNEPTDPAWHYCRIAPASENILPLHFELRSCLPPYKAPAELITSSIILQHEKFYATQGCTRTFFFASFQLFSDSFQRPISMPRSAFKSAARWPIFCTRADFSPAKGELLTRWQ